MSFVITSCRSCSRGRGGHRHARRGQVVGESDGTHGGDGEATCHSQYAERVGSAGGHCAPARRVDRTRTRTQFDRASLAIVPACT